MGPQGIEGKQTKANIKYYDCTQQSHRHDIDISASCRIDKDRQKTKQHYTIVQPRRQKTLKGYSCELTRSTFDLQCGMFSHTKLASIPSIEHPVEVTMDECYNAAISKFYVDHTGGKRNVMMNSVNIFTVDELGTLQESSGTISCRGQTERVGNEIVEGMVKLSQYKLVLKKEKIIEENGSLMAQYSRVKLPGRCNIGDQHCITPTITFIYRDKSQQECEYEKIRDVTLVEQSDGYLIDHKNKLLFQRKAPGEFSRPCGGGTFHHTEYEDLMLTNTSSFHFDAVSVVDFRLLIDTKMDYVQYQQEQRIRSLQLEGELDRCRNRLALEKTSNKIFQLESGRFAVRRGDLLSTFDCKQKVAPILHSSYCWNAIPLESGDFVDPETRILTRHAVRKSCVEFPIVVKSEQGWVKVNPGVSPSHTPDNSINLLTHGTDSEHEDLSHGDLYSQEELDAWNEVLQFGNYQSTLLEEISTGVCNQRANCKQGTASTSQHWEPRYDLEKIIPDPPMTKYSNAISALINKYGTYLSAIILLKWIIELGITVTLLVLTYISFGFNVMFVLTKRLFCVKVHGFKKLQAKVRRFNLGPTFDQTDSSQEEVEMEELSIKKFAADKNNNQPIYTSVDTVRYVSPPFPARRCQSSSEDNMEGASGTNTTELD